MTKCIPLPDIVRLYVEDGLSCELIGLKYGASGATIWNRLHDAGVTCRGRGAQTKYDHLTDHIVSLYSDKRYTIKQIADKLGISSTAVRDRLNDLGALRNKSDARSGIRFSDSHRKRISEVVKGSWQNPETRQRMIEASNASKRSPLVRAHNSAVRKGKPLSPQTRKKLSDALKGAKSYLWKGGLSYEPYCPAFNDFIKEDARNRFGRRCYLCGQIEHKEKHHVHHVDYNKSQGCKGLKWSLIPLCRACHTKTNHRRWYWFALLRDYWIYEYLDFNSNLF